MESRFQLIVVSFFFLFWFLFFVQFQVHTVGAREFVFCFLRCIIFFASRNRPLASLWALANAQVRHDLRQFQVATGRDDR